MTMLQLARRAEAALGRALRASSALRPSPLGPRAWTPATATAVTAFSVPTQDPTGTRNTVALAIAMAAMGATAVATATGGKASDDAGSARCEATPKRTTSGDATAAPTTTNADAPAVEDAPAKPRTRRQVLKARHRHRAKLEEVDLMKIHLEEYKRTQAQIDSLATRFQLYATKTIEPPTTPPQANGPKALPAMTFTDFVHSMILPRFHTKSPHPDVEYSCDFVGNANGLITYEECYLLIHLLQIPKEHFDVAFCMFDLDGDGAVDKAEFCHVIENVLRAISAKEQDSAILISAEETLPRLIKYLFGHYGKKRIRASELEAALDILRKQILRAEFDLYAQPHPTQKNVQAISVHDFAITLISCFDPDRLPPLLERVEALNASDELVTWEDFYKFHFHVQSNLKDIKLAFELIGADEITEADFIRAAHVVTGVQLSFPVVQLAFRVFDSNDNGTLDQNELLKVLERRNDVELQKRLSDSTFKRFIACVKNREE